MWPSLNSKFHRYNHSQHRRLSYETKRQVNAFSDSFSCILIPRCVRKHDQPIHVATFCNSLVSFNIMYFIRDLIPHSKHYYFVLESTPGGQRLLFWLHASNHRELINLSPMAHMHARNSVSTELVFLLQFLQRNIALCFDCLLLISAIIFSPSVYLTKP
jgi:hypothetical protein